MKIYEAKEQRRTQHFVWLEGQVVDDFLASQINCIGFHNSLQALRCVRDVKFFNDDSKKGAQITKILKMHSLLPSRFEHDHWWNRYLVFRQKKNESGKILDTRFLYFHNCVRVTPISGFEKAKIHEIRAMSGHLIRGSTNSRLAFPDSFSRFRKYKNYRMRWRIGVVFTLEHCTSIYSLVME